MSENSILVVGSMAFDSVHTPHGKRERVLGGSANFFSVAASFYSPVKVVAVVGKDFPKDHLDWLESRGIGCGGVEIVDGNTFHWEGKYNVNMNERETLKTDLNVFETFNPRLSESEKECKYVFLGNIHPDIQTSLLDQVGETSLVAMDTMNFWIEGTLNELKKTLSRVDILSINDEEALMLSARNNLLDAAAEIRKYGPSVVIIKRGEYGATLFTDDDHFLIPAVLLQNVVDPTGAGDSFAGAFMGFLAKKGIRRDHARTDSNEFNTSLRQAVFAGCVLASFTCEDFSIDRLKRLEAHEIDARKKHHSERILVEPHYVGENH